ncbi:MAG: hypothetical protein IJ576_02595 [Synergistaceae bacterium]|nr:hypothetical protein [Synergistaceae bacterium]
MISKTIKNIARSLFEKYKAHGLNAKFNRDDLAAVYPEDSEAACYINNKLRNSAPELTLEFARLIRPYADNRCRNVDNSELQAKMAETLAENLFYECIKEGVKFKFNVDGTVTVTPLDNSVAHFTNSYLKEHREAAYAFAKLAAEHEQMKRRIADIAELGSPAMIVHRLKKLKPAEQRNMAEDDRAFYIKDALDGLDKDIRQLEKMRRCLQVITDKLFYTQKVLKDLLDDADAHF